MTQEVKKYHGVKMKELCTDSPTSQGKMKIMHGCSQTVGRDLLRVVIII